MNHDLIEDAFVEVAAWCLALGFMGLIGYGGYRLIAG